MLRQSERRRPGWHGGCLRHRANRGSLPGMTLTERDRAVLDFEGTWWREPGPKARAIRSRLGLSATRYYEILNDLVDRAEAEAYDPLVVRRAPPPR